MSTRSWSVEVTCEEGEFVLEIGGYIYDRVVVLAIKILGDVGQQRYKLLLSCVVGSFDKYG